MLRLAIPLALAELGWMAMSVVDNIMVGRLPDSAVAIGAASLGGTFFYAFAIFGIGLMSGVDTLVSQAFGAGDWPAARRALVSGLGLAMVASPILAACVIGVIPLVNILGVTEVVRDQSAAFAKVLVWSLPLLLLYTTLRRYLQGIHHVRPVMIALITSNLINIIGNWILIYGHWGVPAMGIRGSALSTVIARIYLVAMMGFAVLRRDPDAFSIKPDMAQARRLLWLGLPAATTIGLEVGVFHTATALAAKLGPVSIAAHTVALNAAAVSYMVPLGIGSAAAVSVGKALGAGNRAAAIHAGWTAIKLALAYEVCAAFIFMVWPREITKVYTHDPQVIGLAASLFVIAAIFQLFDGMQTVATGALRGLGNTRTPMIWNLVGYWVIGLPVGCWLCFGLHWGIEGIWDGLCLALILIGLGLMWVWRNAQKVFDAALQNHHVG